MSPPHPYPCPYLRVILPRNGSISTLVPATPQGLLLKMVDGVMATYRTNFFMPNRWGLSLRVDPRLLMTDDELKVCM